MTVKEFDKLKRRDFENGAVLDEIRSALKRAENQQKRIAKMVGDWADNYPVDVFPEDSTSSDGIAAKMARHVCKVLSEKIESGEQ